MPLHKHLVRFFLLVGIYVSLLVIVPAMFPQLQVERAYSAVFRGVNNVLLMRFWVWPSGQVRFLDLMQPKDELIAEINAELPRPVPQNFKPPVSTDVMDTLMMLKNRQTPAAAGFLRTSSRPMGYWPTAFLFCLILAKPLPLGRKGWAMFWGMVLMHLFIAFRISLDVIAGGFGVAGKPFQLIHVSEFWQSALARAKDVFVDNPTTSFVVPILIFFIVAFTRQDWATLTTGGFWDPDEDAKHGTAASIRAN